MESHKMDAGDVGQCICTKIKCRVAAALNKQLTIKRSARLIFIADYFFLSSYSFLSPKKTPSDWVPGYWAGDFLFSPQWKHQAIRPPAIGSGIFFVFAPMETSKRLRPRLWGRGFFCFVPKENTKRLGPRLLGRGFFLFSPPKENTKAIEAPGYRAGDFFRMERMPFFFGGKRAVRGVDEGPAFFCEECGLRLQCPGWDGRPRPPPGGQPPGVEQPCWRGFPGHHTHKSTFMRIHPCRVVIAPGSTRHKKAGNSIETCYTNFLI
ncbi:hypothetical protein DCC81_10530 [Chitinophaga parva]|uniref:Uncharacterized protein n=1 Tax=Chitinophaga parva TaxID=2169414 RepID=A0A2T7BER8_9BACT|nr:hypothetical protein DCC81_10530 [Chitinophaga parva]